MNHAKVSYKVVYRKSRVKATLSNAIKAQSSVYGSHEKAFTAAWELTALIERYVNGRRVARATASNASFRTLIQLDREDVDMMDYELWRWGDDGSGNDVLSPVFEIGSTESSEVEENGGLFDFEMDEGARYVLVYLNAFRLTFINEKLMGPIRDAYLAAGAADQPKYSLQS